MKVSLNSSMLPSWIEEWVNKKEADSKPKTASTKTATVNFKDLPKVTWQDETFGVNFVRQGAELYNSYGNIAQVVDGATNIEEVNKALNENYVVASFSGNDSTDVAKNECDDCDICMDAEEDKDERVVLGEDTAIPGMGGADMIDGASGEITAEVDDEFESELKKVAEMEEPAQQQIIDAQNPTVDNSAEEPVTAGYVSKSSYNKLLARVKQLERLVKADISEGIEDMTGEPSQSICNMTGEVSQGIDDVAENHHNNNNQGECVQECCHELEPCACDGAVTAGVSEGIDDMAGEVSESVEDVAGEISEGIEDVPNVGKNNLTDGQKSGEVASEPVTVEDLNASLDSFNALLDSFNALNGRIEQLEDEISQLKSEEAEDVIEIDDSVEAQPVVMVPTEELVEEAAEESISENESEEEVTASKECESCVECGCGKATSDEHIHQSSDDLAGEPSQGVDDIAGEPSQSIDDVARRRTINNESGGMGGGLSVSASKDDEKECGEIACGEPNIELACGDAICASKKRLVAFSEAFRAVQIIPNDIYDLKSEEEEVKHFQESALNTQKVIDMEHQLDLSKMNDRAKLNENFIREVLQSNEAVEPAANPDALMEQVETDPVQVEEEPQQSETVIVPLDEIDTVEVPMEEDAVVFVESDEDIEKFLKQICPLCGEEKGLQSAGRAGNYTAVECKKCGQQYAVQDKTNKIIAYIGK